MASKNAVQNLMELFLGEYVIIYLTELKVRGSDENNEGVDVSGAVEGNVLDIDDSYFYLGDNGDDVTKAVNHKAISIIGLAKPATDEVKFALEDIPTDEEMH